MSVEFKDNSIQVKAALNEAAIAFLYEAAGEMQSQVKRNTKVASTDTKESWKYKVDEGKLVAYVGSSKQNAIWEEFGTGDYALKGDGRKGGWWIHVGYGIQEIAPEVAQKYKWPKVRYNKQGSFEYVFTYGKRPRRPFFNAYTLLKPKIIRRAKEIFKGVTT